MAKKCNLILRQVSKLVNSLKDKGYSKCMKWQNIRALLRLAVINNRLTKRQA